MLKADQQVSFPLIEVPMLTATRICLGLGVGLLMSQRLSSRQCRRFGKMLALLGAVSTVPFAIQVLSQLGVGQKQSQDTSSLRNTGRLRNRQWQNSSTW